MKELVKKFFGKDIALESSTDSILPDDNEAPENFTTKTKKEKN